MVRSVGSRCHVGRTWFSAGGYCFNRPEGVAVDASDNLYIADTFNGRIRRVTSDGQSRPSPAWRHRRLTGDDGPPTSAALSLPTDVAVDRLGNLYIADFGNSKIRVVANGVITTVAGRTNGRSDRRRRSGGQRRVWKGPPA